MYLCVYIKQRLACQVRPEKSVRSPGAGFVGNWKLIDVDIKNSSSLLEPCVPLIEKNLSIHPAFLHGVSWHTLFLREWPCNCNFKLNPTVFIVYFIGMGSYFTKYVWSSEDNIQDLIFLLLCGSWVLNSGHHDCQ